MKTLFQPLMTLFSASSLMRGRSSLPSIHSPFNEIADTDVIYGIIDFNKKIQSKRNLLIIGDVRIGAKISASGSLMITKVEDDDLLVLNDVPPSVTLNAGRDIFIHGTSPSCNLTAGRNIHAGTKVLRRLTPEQVDYVGGCPERFPHMHSDRWDYEQAGGIAPSNVVHAGGDLYADNIADTVTLHVKGRTETLHWGAYSYFGDNVPDWWPEVTRRDRRYKPEPDTGSSPLRSLSGPG